MDKIEIKEKLINILTKHTSTNLAEVTPDMNLKLDLGLDSLDVAEMVYEIEETFGITIPDSSAEQIQKISDTVDFIHKRLSAAQSEGVSVPEN
jgi:acyl carrier protein